MLPASWLVHYFPAACSLAFWFHSVLVSSSLSRGVSCFFQHLLHARQDLRRTNLERCRELHKGSNSRTADSPLDHADKSAVQAGLQCEPLLRDLLPFPKLAKSLPESLIGA